MNTDDVIDKGASPPEPKVVVTKELIRADMVDRFGDRFPQATLVEMVKDATAKILSDKALWATEGFRGDVTSIQGRVLGVSMSAERNAVVCQVELYPTLPGSNVIDIMEKAGDEAFELAIAGTVDEKDIEVVEHDGREVREIRKVELTGVSFVPQGTKIR